MDMDGSGDNFLWLKRAKCIEVPFFQRPYVWDEEQFESLVDSFMDAPGNTMPFFGSLILKDISKDEKHYLIIDGQQRVTTFNVLIRVLLDLYNVNTFKLALTLMTDLIGCIYNVEYDGEGEEVFSCKLKPSNSDYEPFHAVMDPNAKRPLDITSLGNSPIEQAYKYFYELLSDSENDGMAKQFCLKLHNDNNSLIYIVLDDKDDEQKIFDSVNSLGKSLSNSDIIKNYIFQKMKELSGKDAVKEKQVVDLYYKYWDSVFYANDRKEFWYKEFTLGRVKTDNLECFLKDLAIIKKVYTAKKTTGTYGLCNAYKGYIDSLDINQIIVLVKEIKEYAEIYFEYKTEYQSTANFVWGDYKNRLLLIMDKLETSTFNPYILKLLRDNPIDLENRFFNLEKFFLTRFIYGGTTKNYNQCCEGLIVAEDDAAYYANYLLESPVENESYTVKFRRLTNGQGKLFLFLIEMLSRNGEESKYSDTLNYKSFELEHVMPQKWNENNVWLSLEAYDEDGKLVDKNDNTLYPASRNKAVKSIGNFTLLSSALNKTVSNSAFEIKIKGNGKKNGDGIEKYAAALSTAHIVIDAYKNGGIWDERNIYQNEKYYFELLNKVYSFE